MNIAIIVTGTICSGKSTLSKKISQSLNLNVLDENNPQHFYGILEKVKEGDFTSPVIIEHTDILNVFDENKEYDIGKYFDRKIIILMNVSDDILTKNINDRKLRNIMGDYLKVDMFEMKKNIEKRFNEMPNDFIKYAANITVENNYENENEKITAFLSTCL
jgi:adenylate kinase family enzyme